MIKCKVCGKECKNANGLRLHMRKHENEKPKTVNAKDLDNIESVVENAKNTFDSTTYTGPESGSVITQESKPVEASEKSNKKTMAKLINNNGDVVFIFSFEKSGQGWEILAVNIAEKKNLKLVFE